MAEKRISIVCEVSHEHPAVEIGLAIRVELPGNERNSVGISAPPHMVPLKLHDILWQPKGLCGGVHTAIVDNHFPLEKSSVEVSFTDLAISRSWDDFSEQELWAISDRIQAAVYDAVTVLLKAALAEFDAK